MSSKKTKKAFYKKWYVILISVLVLIFIASSMKSNKGKSDKKIDSVSKVDTKESKKEKSPEVDIPIEFKNSLKKAKTYSTIMSMSKSGIYNQLISEHGEKFSPEAAQYAVDNLNVNYNLNALKKAKSYQKTMAMSPDAIKDQLVSEYGEKFTPEEADYAINNLDK